MFKTMLRGRKMALTAAVTAALATGGAVAFATIPSARGQIDSCYDSATGAVRVVDSDAPACAANEKALRWSERGPAGPTGPRGAQGIPGPARAYWAKFGGANRLIAASEKPASVYAYSAYGYNYVAFNGVDPDKCAVSVTTGTTGQSWRGVDTGFYVYRTGGALNYVMAYAFDSAKGTWVLGVPMDVVVNCSETPYIP